MSVDRAQELAEKLLAETREEVKRADAKAMSCLQAIGGGGFAVLLLTSGTRPGDRLWWAGAAVWVVALLCLAGAIAPRLRGGEPTGAITYFGHVVRLGQPARVLERIEAAAPGDLIGTVAQLCASSQIAMAKFRLIRAAVICAIGAAALVGVGLL